MGDRERGWGTSAVIGFGGERIHPMKSLFNGEKERRGGGGTKQLEVFKCFPLLAWMMDCIFEFSQRHLKSNWQTI